MKFPVPPRAIMSKEPLHLNTTRCKSCHAAVVWMETDKGKRMPLSAATAVYVDGLLVAESHFADCPNAKGHRKRR